MNLLRLIFVVLLTASVLANLPDEIDYINYGKSYQDAKRQSDNARFEAQSIASDIEDTLGEISNVEDNIQGQKDEVLRLKSQISNLINVIRENEKEISFREGENSVLKRQIAKLKDEKNQTIDILNGLSNAIQRPQAKLREIENKIIKKEKDLKRERNLLKTVKAELDRLIDRKDAALNNLNKKQQELTNLQDGISKKENRLLALQSNVEKTLKQLANLEVKKQNLESEISNLEPGIAPLQQKITNFNQKIQKEKNKQADLRSKLSTLKSKKSGLVSNLNSKKSALSKANSELNTLKSKRASLPGEISSLKSSLRTAKNDLNSSKSELSASKGRLQGAKNRIREIGTRMRELRNGPQTDETRRELLKLKDERAKVIADSRVLDKKVKELTSKVSSLQSKVSTLGTTITNKENELREVDSKISSLNSKISNLNSSISSLNSQISSLNSQISSVESELAPSNAKIAELEAKKQNFVNKLNTLKSKISSKKSELNSTKNSISSKKSELNDAKNKIVTLTNDINADKAKITKVKEAIKISKRRVETAKAAIPPKRRELNEVKGFVDEIIANLDRLERRADVQRNEIRIIASEIENKERELSDINNALASRQDDLERNVSAIYEAIETIDQSRKSIGQKELIIKDIDSAIANNYRELDSLNNRLDNERDDYANADRIALNLESITSAKKSAYEKRLSLYNSYLAKAKSLGGAQAVSIAEDMAITAANNEVSTAGNNNGYIHGKRVGLLTGFLKGLVNGKDTGLVNGERDGESSPADYRQGYRAGLIQGAKRAKLEAMRVSYPKGFLTKKGEILGEDYSDQYEDIVDQSTPINPLAETTNSAADALIIKAQNDIAFENKPERSLSIVKYAYTRKAYTVNRSKLNCNSVYKGLSVYKSACTRSYDDSYKSNYNFKHEEVFEDSYEDIFRVAKVKAYEASKSTRYNEGNKKAYDIAYAEAFARGAKVAYQNGYVAGEEKGFEDNLENEKRMAYNLGVKDATSYFANNSALRYVDGAIKINATGIRGLEQNSIFTVDLKVKNFGSISTSDKPWKISVVESTSNISFDSRNISLPIISGNSSFNILTALKGKVQNSARVGSEISFKLKLTGPGDKFETQVVKFTLGKGMVAVNPEVHSSSNFSSKVKWRKWKFWPFKWKYRTNEVKVVLKGLRSNVPGSYTVDFDVVEGADLINIKTPKISISAPGQGQSSTGTLKYQFKKKAKKKSLKLKYTVSYQGEKLASEIISIKVK